MSNSHASCRYLSYTLDLDDGSQKTERYEVRIDEKSRPLTTSQKSFGIQADFVDTESMADTESSEANQKGVQADFEDDEMSFGVQADFSEELSVGVQADMDSETVDPSSKEVLQEGESSETLKQNRRSTESNATPKENLIEQPSNGSTKENIIEIS